MIIERKTKGEAAMRMNSRMFRNLGRNDAASVCIVLYEISEARFPWDFEIWTAVAKGVPERSAVVRIPSGMALSKSECFRLSSIDRETPYMRDSLSGIACRTIATITSFSVPASLAVRSFSWAGSSFVRIFSSNVPQASEQ